MENSSGWTLENGYRNIIATMGISLDGMYRNRIGRMAEELIKARIANWLDWRNLLNQSPDTGEALDPDPRAGAPKIFIRGLAMHRTCSALLCGEGAAGPAMNSRQASRSVQKARLWLQTSGGRFS